MTHADPASRLPPRLAEWLLQRCLPRGIIEQSIRGDIREEYTALLCESSASYAELWFWRQTLRLCVRFAFQRVGLRLRVLGQSSAGQRRQGRESTEGERPAIRNECEDISSDLEQHSRRAEPFGSLAQDIRYALRILRRRPLFTTVAVLTLGLGIGGTTAMFSVIDGVLLERLPYLDPGKLVSVWQVFPGFREVEGISEYWDRGTISYPQYRVWREGNALFQDVAVHKVSEMTLTRRGEPQKLSVGMVSASLFPVLGVQPALGRWFLPEEEASIPGQGAQVAILSDEMWRATFAADPRVAGKILTLDDRSYTVVGVMPRGFRLRRLGPPIGGTVDTGERDLWVPIGQPGAGLGEGAINWEALGRLYPNVPIDHAVAETRRLLVGDADPAERDVRVVPRKEAETRGLGSPLVLLFGATGLLALIACANIATLLLGELNRRRQEVATRSVLGASSRRIVRQLMTESVVLGLLGSVVGVLMAFVGTRILVALAPPIPRIDQVGVDVRVLAFASLLGMLAGLVCGAMPSLMSTGNAGVVSRVSRRTTGTRRERGVQRAVLSLQIALTVVLLIAGGLLGRSLSRLFDVDPGFESESLATVDVSLARVRYSTQEAVSEFYKEVLREIAAIPGVSSASATNGLPFPGSVVNIETVEIAGRAPGPGSGEVAHRFSVAPGYHSAMGIPVLAGRTITNADGPDAPRVTVISESMARRYWPDESPLGARLRYWAGAATVVGIVGDVKLQRLDANVEPTFYVSLLQHGSRKVSLVARTERDPLRVIQPLREAIWSVDRDVPVTQASTMASLVSRSGSNERYRAVLLLVFGVVAALLATAGVFGVTARSVAQRAREMGIRMALGARQEGLVGGVVCSSLGTALAGTVVGLLAALWTGRLISGFLFRVEAWDPLTYGAVVGLLFIVCLVASYVPARRLARIDPMQVLRAE